MGTGTENEVSSVFAFWVRTLLSSRNIPIKELTEIVRKYYPLILDFQWSSVQKGDSITLSEHNYTFQKDGARFSTIVSKTKLCSKSMKRVIWEVTLSNIVHGGLLLFQIGFVDSKAVNKIKWEKCLGDRETKGMYTAHSIRFI